MSALRRRRAARAALALVCATVALPAERAGAQDELPAASFLAHGTGYAVATESPYASFAAVEALRSGGSVIDAAIAAVLDLGVTLQDECGLGGGGFLVHRTAGGKVSTIDFREVAPRAPHDDGLQRSFGTPPYLMTGDETGHDVIAVPGTLAGLALAHQRGGRLPWSTLFLRALHDAEHGYRVAPLTAALISMRQHDLRLFEDSRKVFFKPGSVPYAAGDVMVQPDLAATLKRLATTPEQAIDEFYRTGETARLIADEMVRTSLYDSYGDDSPMTAEDLAAYRPVEREPVVTQYHGHQVYGMGPPSSGGVAIAEILNLLEPYDLSTLSRSDRIHLMAEAQKIAFADRKTWLGDPDHEHAAIPVKGLTSQEYADTRRSEIDLLLAKSYTSGSFDGYVKPPEPDATSGGANTTNVSIIGADGEAAALTCTNERGLGSAVVAQGTGILMNGQLGDFDYGAPEAAANAYRLGARPRSSMAPTLVVKGGKTVLALGSQGGPRIIMAVLETILGVVDDGLPVDQAVSRARVQAGGVAVVHDGRWRRADLLVEHVTASEADALQSDLEGRGHRNVLLLEGTDPLPATVTAVTADHRTGALLATNDTRRFHAVGAPTIPGSRAGP